MQIYTSLSMGSPLTHFNPYSYNLHVLSHTNSPISVNIAIQTKSEEFHYSNKNEQLLLFLQIWQLTFKQIKLIQCLRQDT